MIQAPKGRPRAETRILEPTRSESPTCPVALLRAHLDAEDAAGIAGADFVFSTGPSRRQLGEGVIGALVREAAQCFAADGGAVPVDLVSGHSLRIGGATALAASGYSTAQIAAVGLWSVDSAALLLYVGVADHAAAARPSGNMSSDMGF